jgi:hypothetical protein
LARAHRVGGPFLGNERGVVGEFVVSLVDFGVEFCDIEKWLTVVTRSPPAPGTPESVRENVRPGRTALTEHRSSGAVPTLLRMT